MEETGLQQRKWVSGKESQCCSRRSGPSLEHGWQGWPRPAAPGWTRGILQVWCCFKAVLTRGARHWLGLCGWWV